MNDYEVQVWQEDGEWHATVYLIHKYRGERVHELDGAPHHHNLLNTMNYVGQMITDYERGGGNA